MPTLLFPTRVAHMHSLASEPAAYLVREIAREQTLRTEEDLRRELEKRVLGRQAIPTEPRARARECLARALRPGLDPLLARWLHQEALALDPGNADAIRLAAEAKPRLAARLAEVERAVTVGLERAGGPAAAEGAGGRSWMDVTLRPYLRARGRRAELWIAAGRIDEAVAECEALLDLDEGDAMGLRHRLVGLYVIQRKPGAFRRLVKRHPDDDSAWAAWGEVLFALAADDDAAAEAAHARARRRCHGVDVLVAFPWDAPDLPEGYAHGEVTEALAVAHDLYPACCSVPGAVGWLRGRVPKAKARSARVKSALASLRPTGDFGPEPSWIEWLLLAKDRVPEALVSAAQLDGERGLRWILALLGSDALDVKGAAGSGYGPTSAASLLGRLAPASAVSAMAAVLVRADVESALSNALTVALRGFGPEALEPLLAAHATLAEGEGAEEVRGQLVEALVGLGVRDDRVFEAARGLFGRDPALGAIHLGSLGDARAVPILTAWAETHPIDIEDESQLSNMDLIDVLDSIRELTGTLPPHLAAVLERIRSLRVAASMARSEAAPPRASDPSPDADRDDALDDDPDDLGDDREPLEDLADEGDAAPFGHPALIPWRTDAPPPPLALHPKIEAGRNDPCPCGSGKKYKRCCWDEDHKPPAPGR